MDRGAGPAAVRTTGDGESLAAYLACHSLTKHLKTKYTDDFQQVENVRIRPVADVDPSAWPMVSAAGLPDGVPRHLVRAHALLRWSVYESNQNPTVLDIVDKIISESELLIFSDMGMKHALAGRKGRAQQSKEASDLRALILTTFDRLRSMQPQGGKVEPVVADTAAQCNCKSRTVWNALSWRKKKLTASGPDMQ